MDSCNQLQSSMFAYALRPTWRSLKKVGWHRHRISEAFTGSRRQAGTIRSRAGHGIVSQAEVEATLQSVAMAELWRELSSARAKRDPTCPRQAYIDFMAAYTALLGVLLLLLHRVRVFVSFLGLAALLMEATVSHCRTTLTS
jgi:hypothetical protein